MQTISCADAVARIPDGATLMVGGYMGVGTPEGLARLTLRRHRRSCAGAQGLTPRHSATVSTRMPPTGSR